ncbi:putative trehalase [Trichodelitschia bisporula]|uniref:carnosine N-methyltransferase n=1 Tax=Trichodelitschia bisporula TaxID=703511 RepID=A0A6G1HIW4_9PEZI|nr:putative trehalase [Trichodelitschia bisporula]
MSDPEERRAIYQVLNSFFLYRKQAHYNITHVRRQSFYAMPQQHWQLLAAEPFNFLGTLESIDAAIDCNAEIAEAFLQTGLEFFDLPPTTASNTPSLTSTPNPSDPEWRMPADALNEEKAQQTIRQLFRDWSAEGRPERNACYGPVLDALNTEYLAVSDANKGHIKVLVPGAGLGRLMFEIAVAGYAVEGNEFSYHQIVASNHILNGTQRAGQYDLYPWIHGFSNHRTRADQLLRVTVPDVHPATELERASEGKAVHGFERMSFSSADFCVVYKEAASRGAYDAVATVFFIDTAPNLITYIETVVNCLKDGGVWINVGPLKWHFENNPPEGRNRAEEGVPEGPKGRENLGVGEAGAVELTEDEVLALLERFGFRVEEFKSPVGRTGYVGNPNSMWNPMYLPSFWVARKIRHVGL